MRPKRKPFGSKLTVSAIFKKSCPCPFDKRLIGGKINLKHDLAE